MGKETTYSHASGNGRTNDEEKDALNDANAYLVGISQLNAELEVLSNRDTGKTGRMMNITSKQTQDTKANMQKLNDALDFLCKMADIKITSTGHHVASPQPKFPLEELDEALDFLCKIANIDINKQPVIAPLTSVELMPMNQVQLGENDEESDWDEFVKERLDSCRPTKEKKETRGKVRKFFRRLVGKK